MTDEKRHLPKIDANLEATLLHQQQQRLMQEQIELMAAPFAPKFDMQGKLPILADAILKEQLAIHQNLIPSMLNATAEYPDIEVKVWRPVGLAPALPTDKTNVAEMTAAKRLEDVDDPSEALAAVLLWCFVHFPVARALLRMHGWTYRFEVPKAEEGEEGDDGEGEDASLEDGTEGTEEGA